MTDAWDLDSKPDYARAERQQWLAARGYDKGINPDFKIGDIIQFMTGANDDILAQAKIKGINGQDLYVYNDCFWFPIQNDSRRKIKKV